MKTKDYTVILYASEAPIRFAGGILGDLDVYRFHFLLDRGATLMKEKTVQPESQLRKFLEDQEIGVKSYSKQGSTIWVECDLAKAPIQEHLSWRDVGSENVMAWRTIYWPCKAGTTQECLGFSAPAQKDSLGSGFTVFSVMQTLMGS